MESHKSTWKIIGHPSDTGAALRTPPPAGAQFLAKPLERIQAWVRVKYSRSRFLALESHLLKVWEQVSSGPLAFGILAFKGQWLAKGVEYSFLVVGISWSRGTGCFSSPYEVRGFLSGHPEWGDLRMVRWCKAGTLWTWPYFAGHLQPVWLDVAPAGLFWSVARTSVCLPLCWPPGILFQPN